MTLATRKKKPAPAAEQPADMSAATEPSVRVFTTWTPDLIRSAERQADNGNLRAAANLCDWLLADERLGGVVDARVQGLLGLRPRFEKAGDRRRSTRAANALELGEDWWTGYPESQACQILSWGIVLGLGPAQHSWTLRKDHGGRVLPMPKFWHPQSMRWDWGLRKWFTRTGDSIQEIEFTPGNGQWMLHTPYGDNRPWSMGRWRGLARWALLKEYAMQDWARHSEKGSVLVATHDKASGSGKENRRQLAEEIYALGRDGVVVMPTGFDLKLVEATADTEAIYLAQINAADKAYAVSIRGGNLTTDVGDAGSKAAAEVQERTGDFVKLRWDAETWSTTVHDQSLTKWAEYNFGDPNLAPWPEYPVAPQRNLNNWALTISSAVKAATEIEAQGYELDRAAFLEEFELEEFVKPGKKPEPAKPADATKPGDDSDAEEKDDKAPTQTGEAKPAPQPASN